MDRNCVLLTDGLNRINTRDWRLVIVRRMFGRVGQVLGKLLSNGHGRLYGPGSLQGESSVSLKKLGNIL